MEKQAITDRATFQQYAAAALAEAGFRIVAPPSCGLDDTPRTTATGLRYFVNRVRDVLTATC